MNENIFMGVNMKYYLVALFDEDSYKTIEPLQKNICRKFKIGRNIPSLHIPLEAIENPNLEKLDDLILDIIKPYKRFKIEMGDDLYFNEPFKSFNLKVENKGYIKRLARIINTDLRLHGFNTKNLQNDNNDLFVSLAVQTSNRDVSSLNENSISTLSKKVDVQKLAKIDRIELWKANGNKKESIVKSYPLKTF